MTVSTEKNKEAFAVYSGAAAYNWTGFVINADADVEVYAVFPSDAGDAAATAGEGSRLQLTLTTDFTVASNAPSNGGAVTINSTGNTAIIGHASWVSNATTRIAIYRSVDAITQLNEYNNQGAFLSNTIEASFDGIYFILQQHEERLGRTIQLDPWDTVLDGFTEANQRAAVRLNDLSTGLDGVVVWDGTTFNISASVSSADLATVAGISTAVSTVAGISANVTTVAGIAANVTTVAGIAANVTTVAGVSADVTTVAADISGTDTIGSAAVLVNAGNPGIPFIASAGSASLVTFGTGLALDGAGELTIDAELTDISGLTPTDGLFIVGNGADFVGESGDTALTSLGLTPIGLAIAKIVDGVAGQFVTTDGAGAVSYATPAGGGDTLAAANETIAGNWAFTGAPTFTGAPVLSGATFSKASRNALQIYDTAVDLLSDLEALTAGDYRVVSVKDRANSLDNGGGLFGWLSGDQSALITDTAISVNYAGDSTNGLRNSRGEGATGATPPTNWNPVGGAGLAATYTRTIRDGVPGVEARFYGTANGTALQLGFEGNSQVAAVSGEDWTSSAYFELVAGSVPVTMSMYLDERDTGGGYLQRSTQALTLNSTLARQSVSRALTDGSTVYAVAGIVGTPPVGATDFTVFIGAATLDEASTVRPSCMQTWGTLTASTIDDVYEEVNHGLYTGEKVRANHSQGGLTSGTDYWVERINQFQYRLHTTLLSCYDNSAPVTSAAIAAGSPTLTVSRLKDPGKALYVPPSSDVTGASGVWRRLSDAQYVNIKWAGATDTSANRAETVQNAVNALDAGGTVFVPNPGHSLSAPTRISRSNVIVAGQQKNETVLDYSGSTSGGLIFAHPDAGETGSRISGVVLRDISVWGNDSINAVTFNQCTYLFENATITGGFYGLLARGCQISTMSGYSVITFCETAEAACVRHEEGSLYGGESFVPAYTTIIHSGVMIGDTIATVSAVVTGVTQADPAVVTTDTDHGLSSNNEVWFNELTGMDELEGRVYKITVLSSTTFSLQDPYTGVDVDSTGFVAYSSGGTLTRIRRCDYLLSVGRSDGLEFSDSYWGSARKAYVYLDAERSPGVATGGIYSIRFNNIYYDGLDNTGTSYRSPKNILWIPDNGVGGSVISNLTWSNTVFANGQSPQAGPLVLVEDYVVEMQFSNCVFLNSNEELIYIDNGGTAQGDFLFSNCTFLSGGLSGSHDMIVVDGARTLSFSGGRINDASSGRSRVRIEGTVDHLISTTSFQGTTQDFDVNGTVTKKSIVGLSDATVSAYGNHLAGLASLAVGNITTSGNTISSTDTNGDINLTPNGTGKTVTGRYGTPHTLTIADNAADTIALNLTAGQFCRMMIESYSSYGYGDAHFRADGTTVKLSGAISVADNTALTGTSGVDPGITVSYDTSSGNLYVENRGGSAVTFRVWVFGPY